MKKENFEISLGQVNARIVVACVSAMGLLLLSGSGCTSSGGASNIGAEPLAQSVSQPREPVLTRISAAQSPTAVVLRNYLAAAGKQDPSASKRFLSADCTDDIVVECQANANSGWMYSEEYSGIESDTISADGKSATVKARVTFSGGNPPTFMASEKTFFLVLENGEWKISAVDPKPKQAGPGVRPL